MMPSRHHLARYIQHAAITANPDYDPEASRTMVPSGSVRMRPPTRPGCESSCVTQICALERSQRTSQGMYQPEHPRYLSAAQHAFPDTANNQAARHSQQAVCLPE